MSVGFVSANMERPMMTRYQTLNGEASDESKGDC